LKQIIFSALEGFPLIHPGDDLAGLIFQFLKDNKVQIVDGDILVLAQKIVSKAEGRYKNLSQVQPGMPALELGKITGKDPRFIELVLGDSKSILRAKNNTLIVEHRLGFVCANAGIDHSNVAGDGDKNEEWILMLPENPDASAREIQKKLEEKRGAHLGVMIIDSHGRAWREGVVGVAIGLAGMPGVVDMRGKSDLFGYKLKITTIGVADELAAAASLVMGQANEATPIVHVRGFPYPLREGSLKELLRLKGQDLFR